MNELAMGDEVSQEYVADEPPPDEPGDGESSSTADLVGARGRTLELGRFLRNRRARITPEKVGFPVGPHRRSRGLRREEVAVLAGVSPTWYTYLEQGRKIRPSPEVLDSLAHVLELTEDERRYIHLLALGHGPVNSSTSPAATDSNMLWSIVRSIGGGPDPLYIGNQYGDVVAWNDATTAWFTDFGKYPVHRRNMLWWMLTDPEARQRVVNWAEDTRDVVARLRSAYATRPQDPKFDETVKYLANASPEFRDWWAAHDVHDQRTRLRTMRAPGLGTRTFRVLVLRMTDDTANSTLLHLPLETDRPPSPT